MDKMSKYIYLNVLYIRKHGPKKVQCIIKTVGRTKTYTIIPRGNTVIIGKTLMWSNKLTKTLLSTNKNKIKNREYKFYYETGKNMCRKTPVSKVTNRNPRLLVKSMFNS